MCLSGLGGCGTFERTVLCVFCWGFTLLVYQNSRTDACSASERGCSCVGTVPFVMCGAASCINLRHSSICEEVCFSLSLCSRSLLSHWLCLLLRLSFVRRSLHALALCRHLFRFSFFVPFVRSSLCIVLNYIFLLLFS